MKRTCLHVDRCEICMKAVIHVQANLSDINLFGGKLAIFTEWSMLTLKMLLNEWIMT